MRTNWLMDEFAGYPEDHYAISLNGRYWLVRVGVSPSQVSIPFLNDDMPSRRTYIDYP
jgi:hypothetical protein